MRSSWSALTDDAVEVLGTWAEDPGGTDPEATAWGVFIPLYESEERAQEEAATRLDRVLGALECEARIRAFLERECKPLQNEDAAAACLGIVAERITLTPFHDIARVVDFDHHRPKQQWWMELRPILRMLAQPGPQFNKENPVIEVG